MPNLKISQFTNLASGSQGTSLIIPFAQTNTTNYGMTLDALFSDIAYNTADRGIGMIGVATASAPSVSAAGKSKTYFDTTLNKQMLSREGAAYQQIIVGSPSFPLSVSNSTGQITATTSDTGAAVTNPGLVVTRGDNKRTAQLWITPGVQLLLSSEIITAQGDNKCALVFNKQNQGGGAAPSTASLGLISFQSNGNTSAYFEVLSLGGTIGNTATFFTTRSGTLSNVGVFGVDNWGTFRVSRTLGPFYGDVQLSDPSKLMVIGNIDTLNDTTKVCLHIRNAIGFTDQINLLLQAVSGQTTNLFECKTSANVKTLQITAAGVLSPGVAAQVDLGTSALPFKDLYLAGSSGTPASNNFRITGTATAARVITLPDASITISGSASALTSGRIPFATTGGLLTDSANATLDSSGNLYTAKASIGSASLTTAQLNVTPASSSTIGAIVKGAASQSANLTEWQNSAGTVLASISAAGRLGVGGTPSSEMLRVVSGSGSIAFFDGRSSSTSIASAAAIIISNSDPTTNNRAAIFFSDALGGAAAGSIEFVFTDRPNNYGEVVFGLRSASGYQEVMRLSGDGSQTLINGANFVLGTTTGTKIGTATTQKLSLWNATPIVQPSSTGQTAGFTAGAGTNVVDASTFTGGVGSTAYTIGDIVRHLKNFGLIAQ